jgi:hypothetical protein
MLTWRIARIVAGALLILLFSAFVLGCLLNAEAIKEVRVRLKPGAEEPGDHHLLGIGDRDKLPDYSLRIRTRNRWAAAGTQLNTTAANWLVFPVKAALPLRHALELQLVEEDKLENDVLEQLPLTAMTITGKQFEFQIGTERSFESGMEWFFDTPIGKAISLGITIAVIAVILALLGPILPF